MTLHATFEACLVLCRASPKTMVPVASTMFTSPSGPVFNLSMISLKSSWLSSHRCRVAERPQSPNDTPWFPDVDHRIALEVVVVVVNPLRVA